MNRKTLTALKGSIRKWEKIVNGTGSDFGPANCPLCALFFQHRCAGCPVSEKSGWAACLRTPYSDWREISDLGADGRRAETLPQKKAALAELRFLKSLLPKKAK